MIVFFCSNRLRLAGLPARQTRTRSAPRMPPRIPIQLVGVVPFEPCQIGKVFGATGYSRVRASGARA